jgi:hypothetical protein
MTTRKTTKTTSALRCDECGKRARVVVLGVGRLRTRVAECGCGNSWSLDAEQESGS